MSEFKLRLAEPCDRGALAALMIEMQRHYDAPHPPQTEIEAQLGALPPGVEVMLADREGCLAGLRGLEQKQVATTSPLTFSVPHAVDRICPAADAEGWGACLE
jgi:hypothetical protein